MRTLSCWWIMAVPLICVRCRFRKISLAAAMAVLLSAASAADISIQFDGRAFRVAGWNAAGEPANGWASVFAVYTGSQAMLGSYDVANGVLAFHPRFPIAAGVNYRAVFKAAGIGPVEAVFDGPPSATNPLTRVNRIYPSTDILPSNALRLYVYFSAPMSR